jgi:hypothetical protein
MAKTVVVDGIPYTPAAAQRPPIGIAITTHNRPEVLAATLDAFGKYAPEGTPIIVLDDGSNTPAAVDDWVTLVRNEVPQGIPAAKNRCIEELMRLGVQHLFLFDDDCRPDADEWWKPYTESPEHHFQYSWTHFTDGKPVPRMDVLHQDSRTTAYGWSMGCMLYLTAEAVNRCGGMRFEFGQGMEEHADLSRRIYNAGLTTFVHQDVTASKGLFYAADEHQKVKRSIPAQDRAALCERNQAIRIAHHHDDRYVEYRQPKDVVLSCFFNSKLDPQRNIRFKPDQNLVAALEHSVTSASGADIVMFTDCLPNREDAEAVHVAYRQRWITYYQWLIQHPEVRYVWCVDATDVRMLNNPFPDMHPGLLYVGWEPKTVGIQWIQANGSAILEWIYNNAQRPLLNAGVVGGDRATVMEFIRAMQDLWYDLRADAMHEMPFLNRVVYEHFSDRHLTGPQVATIFKANAQSDPVAWWAHK